MVYNHQTSRLHYRGR